MQFLYLFEAVPFGTAVNTLTPDKYTRDAKCNVNFDTHTHTHTHTHTPHTHTHTVYTAA